MPETAFRVYQQRYRIYYSNLLHAIFQHELEKIQGKFQEAHHIQHTQGLLDKLRHCAWLPCTSLVLMGEANVWLSAQKVTRRMPKVGPKIFVWRSKCTVIFTELKGAWSSLCSALLTKDASKTPGGKQLNGPEVRFTCKDWRINSFSKDNLSSKYDKPRMEESQGISLERRSV